MKYLCLLLLLLALPRGLLARRKHVTSPPTSNPVDQFHDLLDPTEGTLVRPTNLSNSTIDEEIEFIIQLLEEGETYILLGEQRDATIVLGLTGAGKSTVVQLLAGDNAKLISVQVGNGEYIIVDENGHIGNSTLLSHTIIPEMVIDEESDATYYDCPGFSDTRNASFDIAASYFINKVLVHASTVKILFIVDHSHVRSSVDRTKFMEFLKHATTLINDIDYFNKSIAVVINKVENQFEEDEQGNWILVSDEDVTLNVVDFFAREVIPYLESEIESGSISQDKIVTYKKSIQLLNIFLISENDSYLRINLFRRPMKAGPLSENIVAQKSRTNIIDTLTNTLDFVLTTGDDFSDTISDNSKLYVISLVKQLTKNIINLCTEFQLKTMEYIAEKCIKSIDIYNLYDDFRKTAINLNSASACKESIEESKIIDEFLCTVNIIGYQLTVEQVTDIVNYLNFLVYFEKFIDDENADDNKFSEVVILQKDLIENFEKYHSWYIFLYNLYDKLSEFSFQLNRENFNVADIENWGQPNKTQGIQITTNNVHKFLEKLEPYKILEYNNVIKHKLIEDFIIRDMNIILNITLKTEVTVENPNTKTLRISGENIVISRILKYINSQSLNLLELFALNNIHVDGDINEPGKELQLVIAARKWNAVTTLQVILNGETGKPHNPPVANDGYFEGENGEAGKPGNPGQTSGSFLGLGLNFENTKLMSISVKGGVGGKGQQGGKGGKGRDGREPNWRECREIKNCHSVLSFDSLQNQNCKHKEVKERRYDQYLGFSVRLTIARDFELQCYDGQIGADGGHGGAPGFGGYKGEYFLFYLKEIDNKINYVNVDGEVGDPGIGGNGGIGGQEAKIYIPEYVREGKVEAFYFWVDREGAFQSVIGTPNCETSYCVMRGSSYPSHPSGKTGKSGINGENKIGIIKPSVVREFYKIKEINAYKYFLRENIDSNIGHAVIEEYYMYIENNEDIQNLQNTLDFIEEIKDLEMQYRTYVNNIDILPFYENYLIRLNKYANSFEEHYFPVSDKMLLNYVYTVALSRICVIKSKSDRNLIIDLVKYMELARDNINTMKELESTASSIEIRKSYKSSINKKIEEAEFLIDSNINAELLLLQKELDYAVEDLLNEVIILLENAEENREALRREREKIQKNIINQSICGIFKLVGDALSFFGPHAAMVGSVISSASQIAESIVVDTSAGSKPEIITPGGVQNTIDIFNKTLDSLNEPLKVFKGVLDEISDLIENIPEITKVRSLITQIESEYSPDEIVSLLKIKKHSDEITNVAEKEEKELKDKEDEEKYKEALAALDKIKKMNAFTQSMFSFVQSQEGNHQALEEIDRAIRENEELILKLLYFLDHIYAEVIPLIREMFSELLDLKNNLENHSHVALDVKSYEIQKLIRSVKYDIQELTQDFKVENKFMRIFLQLEDACNLLIKLYDRIQSYKEQEEFADYIGALLSSEFKNFQHLDPKYQEAVTQLELVTASNTVVEQYERAKGAFKQQIFPFSSLYASVLNVPLYANADYNLDDLTREAVQKFDVLKAKYTEILATIVSGQDENIYFAEFDSQYNTSHAFYVWNQIDYKKEINTFLLGKEVMLRSNIMKSSNKNAIKFNKLDLKFKCNDPKLQNELDDLIKFFDIELQHSGSNYYRCNNRYYVIPGENLLISYSYEKDKDGKPIRKNVVYDKILKGDILLSPYTLWTLRLVNASSVVGFDRFTKFKSEINLELSGRGMYVKPDLDICDTSLENDYDLYEDANFYVFSYSVGKFHNRNWW